MSGLKLNGLGSLSALFLCALVAGGMPPVKASEPSGPMLIGATNDPVASSETQDQADASADSVREARRLLIDLPGSDPLSARTNALLLFGGELGGAGPDDDADAPSQVAKPAAQPNRTAADISPEMMKLCNKIRTVLSMYYPKCQSARDNSPWELMHAIIAYGIDTQIFRDGPGSEKVNAIGYMCYNYPCRGQQMLFVNRGMVDASRGVGVQGHGGQFLAILAQSHVMRDYPMLVEGKKFTLEDLIAREQQTCLSGEELTFKLIALSHYLDSDASWKTPDGQQWSIQRLIREELAQPVRGAACGGTHRLMGFSYALHKRRQQNKPIEGEFKRRKPSCVTTTATRSACKTPTAASAPPGSNARRRTPASTAGCVPAGTSWNGSPSRSPTTRCAIRGWSRPPTTSPRCC